LKDEELKRGDRKKREGEAVVFLCTEVLGKSCLNGMT